VLALGRGGKERGRGGKQAAGGGGGEEKWAEPKTGREKGNPFPFYFSSF